ncbi:RfbX Membrane protein involved in the export of O-antigen and teichoic acid [Comamonadaceae bacterium]
MAALKDIAFMGTSTLVRLVFGLLTFAIMARLLGPNDFGLLMFWLSVATLLSLVANYGFTPYVLREIGSNRSSANKVMGEVLSAKILVSGFVVAGSLLAMPFMSATARSVFLLMTLAMLVDSVTDFLNVGYRATNRFSSETRIATIASVSQFVIVAGAIWFKSEILIAAGAFLVSRTLVLLITWANQAQYFASLRPSPLPKALSRLKSAFSYAYDFGLQSLIGQVDSLILNYFLGPVAVGMHQAGMRVFLGGGQIANVLGNVFIPKLSGLQNDATAFKAQGQKLQVAFLVSGAAFGLTLAIAAELIVKILFGADYQPLVILLPWFGLLFFIRFFAAAYGVLLTSAGKQGLRAKANLVHWVIILSSALWLVPKLGNIGWILALAIGNAFLAAVYFAAMRSALPLRLTNSAIVVGTMALFTPFLHVS